MASPLDTQRTALLTATLNTLPALQAQFQALSALFAAEDASDRAVYNVLSYGAKGDGIHDDAPALQAAINAVAAVGGILYTPAGTYRCNGGLTIPARGWTWIGDCTQNISVSNLLYYGASGSLLHGNAAEMPYGGFWGGIHVENVSFNQAGNSPDPLVAFQGMIYSRFSGCRFLSNGHQSSASLLLDYNCISNEFQFCDIQGADNFVGLQVNGQTASYPNLNRFLDCAFTGPSTQKVTGAVLNGASTCIFTACQFEGLKLGIKFAHPFGNSRYNTLFHPRFENCLNMVDWSSAGDVNFVFARYTISSGADLNPSVYTTEVGQNVTAQHVFAQAYSAPDADQIRFYSNHPRSGLALYSGTYGDWSLANRKLSIFSQGGQAYLWTRGATFTLEPEYGINVQSDNPVNPSSKFALNLPIQPATLTDAQAPAGTIYFSSNLNKLAFKDSAGVVNALY